MEYKQKRKYLTFFLCEYLPLILSVFKILTENFTSKASMTGNVVKIYFMSIKQKQIRS